MILLSKAQKLLKVMSSKPKFYVDKKKHRGFKVQVHCTLHTVQVYDRQLFYPIFIVLQLLYLAFVLELTIRHRT